MRVGGTRTPFDPWQTTRVWFSCFITKQFANDEERRKYERERKAKWREANPQKAKTIQDRYYQNNREKEIASAYARKKANLAENRRKIRKIKSTTPCADCGLLFKPHVMDFDHVRGNKRGNVSEMIRSNYSWASLEAEISKCVLRCSNCHREKTHRRLQYQKKKAKKTAWFTYITLLRFKYEMV